MKKILKFTAILLILTSSFTCEKEEEEKMIEIPFTEYSLVGTSCQWTNLDYEGKVIVINSNEELAQYVICTEGSYPEIDFSKNTLLLARGGTTWGIASLSKNVFNTGKNKYIIEVEIILNDATVAQGWHICIIISTKLNAADNVELKVNTIRN
ncbi:MAG: hypothetical protein LBQ28_01995 [Prevotellaceae bacterium]|jgi:hypothetical protein|nr:hypothetical protein [Prevotellaceae bacterium]